VVLEEEEWIAKMEGIIERDFFPELGRLQDKVAWLEAVRSGDPERIRQAQLQIARRRHSLHQQQQELQQNTQRRQGQQQTPYTQTRGRDGGYTPYNTGDFLPNSSLTGGDPSSGVDLDSNVSVPPVSLDTFLANHTSEDNASFHDILEKTNKRRKERAIATLGAPSNDPALLLTDGKERTDGFGTSGQPIDTQKGWKYTAKNMLMYDGSTRNSLALSKREIAGLVPGPPPAINHSATRLHQQVQRNAGLLHAAGDGGVGSDTTSIDTESTGAEMTEEEDNGRRGGRGGGGRGDGGRGRRGNEYDILATPSFDPGVDASPLITWGDIEATPMRIEAEDLLSGGVGDGKGPMFKINDSSKRERKAHELAKKAGATLRNRPGGVGGAGRGSAHTPARAAALAALGRTPASAHGGGGSGGGGGGATPLSHAAQRLVGRMKKTQNTGADAALRASYTPRHGGAGGGGGRSGRETPLSGWESGAATPSLR
jgi:protein DGCR14